MSKDAFYFRHDANAHQDPRILKLIMKHKMEGFGLYWLIIEKMRNEQNYKIPNDPDYLDALAYQAHCESITVILDAMVEVKLLSRNDDWIWSESFLKRMEEMDVIRDKARESARKRWNKSEGNADAEPTQSEGNAKKEKNKQVKDKKEKNKEEYNAHYDAQMLELYELYPRKKDRARALKAIKSALERDTYDAIKSGLLKYTALRKGEKPEFTKYPASWFNAESWKDEPDIMTKKETIQKPAFLGGPVG